MREDRNYFAYIVYERCGKREEYTVRMALRCGTAYDEAVRLADDYGAIEAGIRVYTPGCFRILNWKHGEYRRLQGCYLYTIRIR